MSLETDVAAVRVALFDAIEQPRRSRKPWLAAVVALLVLGSTGGALAATGVIFAPPQIDHSVPAVAEWTYYSHNPYGHGGGAVLLRRHPEATARENRANEQALAAQGITARCGVDADHPLACFAQDGSHVMPPVIGDDGPNDYDVKTLTPAEAHAWLCTHPEQRPGADGGEKPAPPLDGC